MISQTESSKPGRADGPKEQPQQMSSFVHLASGLSVAEGHLHSRCALDCSSFPDHLINENEPPRSLPPSFINCQCQKLRWSFSRNCTAVPEKNSCFLMPATGVLGGNKQDVQAKLTAKPFVYKICPDRILPALLRQRKKTFFVLSASQKKY